MFTYDFADIAAQMQHLPVPVALWVNWLAIVFVPPFFFVRHRLGRWVAAIDVVFLAVQTPLLLAVGLSGLLSLPHLLLWTPMAAILLWGLRTAEIELHSVFGAWAVAASATMIISLVFDVRDFARWVGGHRAVPGEGVELASSPIWPVLIVVALAAATYYVAAPRLRAQP